MKPSQMLLLALLCLLASARHKSVLKASLKPASSKKSKGRLHKAGECPAAKELCTEVSAFKKLALTLEGDAKSNKQMVEEFEKKVEEKESNANLMTRAVVVGVYDGDNKDCSQSSCSNFKSYYGLQPSESVDAPY